MFPAMMFPAMMFPAMMVLHDQRVLAGGRVESARK
jgi:hypothetical protein